MADKYNSVLDILSNSGAWTEQKETAILEPYTYISANPGKEIRGKMIEAFNVWLQVRPEQLDGITKIVNMLHTASLLVDDIEDDSQLRRGNPVAHKIYGIPQTINTANYVFFQAFKELIALRQTSASAYDSSGRSLPDLDSLVTEELLCLHRGQGLEILWRDSLQCPTEEEYIGMVNNKTGGLLRLGIKLMMACATTNTDIDYIPLVNLIGIYYQIRDDYMNLQSAEYSDNKGFAEDLTEGKFSFPVVHSIHADQTNRQVLNVLQKRPATPTLKRHTVAYMRDHTKSFEYTLAVIHNIEQQTRAEIARLGGNVGLDKIMDALHVDAPTTS
ncbi:hypothetical protein HGRIS_001794 [Hohenbuehelia grisea]|uniref:(2E,6E)-farnesyl diphosphate synthase n=1 Tax=Hohenbuehelia grisea TaxID=104357 RepID=A0ABR3JK83_9AGAR